MYDSLHFGGTGPSFAFEEAAHGLCLGLSSLALAQYFGPNWYWLTAFVGANLLQSSFSGFCPLAVVAKKLGARPGAAF